MRGDVGGGNILVDAGIFHKFIFHGLYACLSPDSTDKRGREECRTSKPQQHKNEFNRRLGRTFGEIRHVNAHTDLARRARISASLTVVAASFGELEQVCVCTHLFSHTGEPERWRERERRGRTFSVGVDDFANCFWMYTDRVCRRFPAGPPVAKACRP